MKLNITKEQKIGLFVLMTLLGSYFLIVYMKGKNIFHESNTYYTIVENVEGLNSTGPVFIKGLKIGAIEKVVYNPERDNFLIRISVETKYRLGLNSISEIYSTDLLGNKSIRIVPGDTLQYLKDGDTISSKCSEGFKGTLEKEILSVKEKAEQLFDTMNTTLKNINDILDEQTKDNLRKSVENFNMTMRESAAIATNINNNREKISSIITNLNNILNNIDKSSGDFTRSIKNISEITDSIKKADIIGTMESLKEVINSIQNENGTIGKLLKTDTLHNSLEKILSEINLLIDNINKNPKRYLRLSVF